MHVLIEASWLLWQAASKSVSLFDILSTSVRASTAGGTRCRPLCDGLDGSLTFMNGQNFVQMAIIYKNLLNLYINAISVTLPMYHTGTVP